jgi:hypothetical protein
MGYSFAGCWGDGAAAALSYPQQPLAATPFPLFAALLFRRGQQLVGSPVVVDNRLPQCLVIVGVAAKGGGRVVPGPLADQVAVKLGGTGIAHAQVVECVPLVAADAAPVKSNIFSSLSQPVIAESLPGIFRPGPGLFYQRHPFAEVVDGLHLPVTQPDFNRQPIGERPGGQDNEVLLRLIVGVYVGDDDLIGVESGPCPVGNGRVDGLAGVGVHEAIALLVSGLIKLPVIIGVWGVVVTVGLFIGEQMHAPAGLPASTETSKFKARLPNGRTRNGRLPPGNVVTKLCLC